ncbi:uncharacterized protein LOC111389236 isoform X3 [Olea europaea var. sylvestris]|uniref:uncharacterized protein LOC111389236 isoform X2 n=1 Tax=Olea europaea var. sylvestris TaxID=158386 RepID=UPI000C1D448B|nr:uncharacterized protein LOC111389236 isoform X2 [Olea europaea var. sylvestris]XP_022869912.1 uncharacterized protein LOC111389236 isoform X3 [Olea europaea var. sylvestris]
MKVDRNAKQPVCKIVDYSKEKYQQQLKEKERCKSKKQKDMQMKADTAKRLMESGYRVKPLSLLTSWTWKVYSLYFLL